MKALQHRSCRMLKLRIGFVYAVYAQCNKMLYSTLPNTFHKPGSITLLVVDGGGGDGDGEAGLATVVGAMAAARVAATAVQAETAVVV